MSRNLSRYLSLADANKQLGSVGLRLVAPKRATGLASTEFFWVEKKKTDARVGHINGHLSASAYWFFVPAVRKIVQAEAARIAAL